MKTLTLDNKQYNLLVEVSLEERATIRETFDDMLDEERLDAIDTYNELGTIFDLEPWTTVN